MTDESRDASVQKKYRYLHVKNESLIDSTGSLNPLNPDQTRSNELLITKGSGKLPKVDISFSDESLQN